MIKLEIKFQNDYYVGIDFVINGVREFSNNKTFFEYVEEIFTYIVLR